MKPATRIILKRILYGLLIFLLIAAVGTYGAYQFAMYRLFQETPNRLSLPDQMSPVPFKWSRQTFGEHVEPHAAILIPVSVPGISHQLYMQFDTGSADSFLRSGALDSLQARGVNLERYTKDDQGYVNAFEFTIAGNKIVLESGPVRQRAQPIDWDNPQANNIIGSLGADFLDQRVCEIDFPAQEIRFHRTRPDRLNELGTFTPFSFKGRRIMFPANIDGSDVEVFYDSGCSAFGLLTSKYHYDRLTDPNALEIGLSANRHGEAVPIHHKPSDFRIKLGSADLALRRVSYAELYTFLQTTIGRMVGGGFLGNKCLTDSTLIIDTLADEFLVIDQSLKAASSQVVPQQLEKHTPSPSATSASDQD